MSKNKLIYEAPEAETLVVRFEGNFCGTGDFTKQGTEEGNDRDGESEGFIWS